MWIKSLHFLSSLAREIFCELHIFSHDRVCYSNTQNTHKTPQSTPVKHKISHGQLAMNIWRDEMIEKVHEPLVSAILHDITGDRRGVSTYSVILRDVIPSFVEVSCYV